MWLQYCACRGLFGDPAVSAISRGDCAVSSNDSVRSVKKSENDPTISSRKLMLVLTLMLV